MTTTGKVTGFVGAIATVIGFLDTQSVLSILPTKVAAVVAAVGGLLAVFGVTLHTDQTAKK
jgi:hypothetical protein